MCRRRIVHQKESMHVVVSTALTTFWISARESVCLWITYGIRRTTDRSGRRRAEFPWPRRSDERHHPPNELSRFLMSASVIGIHRHSRLRSVDQNGWPPRNIAIRVPCGRERTAMPRIAYRRVTSGSVCEPTRGKHARAQKTHHCPNLPRDIIISPGNLSSNRRLPVRYHAGVARSASLQGTKPDPRFQTQGGVSKRACHTPHSWHIQR